jgi:hypothetical protein
VNRQLQKLNAGDDVETPDLTSAQLLQSLSKNMLDLVLTGKKGQVMKILFSTVGFARSRSLSQCLLYTLQA